MMSRPILNVLVLIIVVNQVTYVFGKFTTLRGSIYNRESKVICVSEDDGSALIWNTDLYDPYTLKPIIKPIEKKFYSTCAYSYNDQIDCEINDLAHCLDKWNKSEQHWKLTDSRITPMGPVFDQRWEGKIFAVRNRIEVSTNANVTFIGRNGSQLAKELEVLSDRHLTFSEFQEYAYDAKENYNIKLNNMDKVVLPFSVRAWKDVHILICNKEYTSGLCYWIIIGGWDNTKSVIRKCQEGVPAVGSYPDVKSDCATERDSLNHTALDPYEWRTFVLTWNSQTRNISLYDPNQLIITYKDPDEYENVKFDYKLYIRSPLSIFIRYHHYMYFYTVTEHSILTSNTFTLNTNAICLQLLIGLCTECDADIFLLDAISNNILQFETVKGSSVVTDNGLPMWQSVKILLNVTSSYNDLKLKVIPKLNSNNVDPIWAIGYVRQCFQHGCFRQSIVTISQIHVSYYHYIWPNVTCQKLSYKDEFVIHPLNKSDTTTELDVKNCIPGYVEPACTVNCQSTLKSNSDCKGVAICYSNGCTCPPGYVGIECNMPCSKNSYGYACKEKCGSCQHNKQCDIITGMCLNGCHNTEDYIYASPFCKIGIGKPNEIEIFFKNQTTIVATVPIKWEKKYEGIEFTYSFIIKERYNTFQPEWKNILPNTTLLSEVFTDLKFGTTFQIMPVLSLAKTEIHGSWKTVDTLCDPVSDIRITPNETSFIIEVGESKNKLYQCPLNSYKVEVKNNNNPNERIRQEFIYSFPFSLLYLTPYTSYNVTIRNKYEDVFVQEVYTLESVPSKVLTLEAMSLSSSKVSIYWTPPKQPNGLITEYVVYLKITVYRGCSDYKISASSNETIVKRTSETKVEISGLHAYADYSVEVIASNSRYSSIPAMTKFSLNESVIPAVTFTQLRMQNWLLLWNRPEDCTKYLGPLAVARISIRGLSNNVNNFSVVKNTQNKSLNLRKVLYGAEWYIARIYVLRGFNLEVNNSAYEEYKFQTPPKEPPEVTNLTVVEVDTRYSPANIHLRWQSPSPPLNGVLRAYGVDLCRYGRNNAQTCNTNQVQLDEFCDLWDNYICKTVRYSANDIKVIAYNVNVSKASPAVDVTPEMINNITPDAPRNFTTFIDENNVVDLKWLHPDRTGRHLLHFTVALDEISSDLRGRARRSTESKSYQFAITDYKRSYSMRLYLLPSTEYNISVKAVTINYIGSNAVTLNVRTPSTIDFVGNVTFNVYEFNSTIAVKIPGIVNSTRTSVLYVIVKGPYPCDNYLPPPKELWEQAGVKQHDIAWQAVAVSTSRASNKEFKLGSTEIYGNATNCPLKSGEEYNVAVIISEPNLSYKPITITTRTSKRIGMKPSNPASWLIPVLIIFVAVAVAIYFYHNKKRQKLNRQLMLQDEMVLSQNIETYEHDTKSVIDTKQAPSTPSDRQSLSRATTPEMSTTNVVIENNEEEQKITSLVKVKDFEDYVRQAIESGLLDKQYETFPRGQTQPWDYGKLPQNKTKNRYGNLIAYDETRVILKKLPDDAYSDYINANYITGYKKKNRYIATQGPKPNTVVDFWRMIWQEKVLIICMLANVIENGKTKCEQYWPDIGKKKKYGEVVVLNATHNVFADYCFRTLHVTCGKETRKVEHLHYTAWPDHGVPMYTHSVVTYLKKLLATPPGDGPVVVHCSAGVGRTGTIVLCDICLHRAAAEGVVDVFAETASIRRERANMVDNKQQYLLAHLALVECLLIIPTTLPCNETLPTRIKELKKQLLVQQQRLQNTAWQDEALRPVTSPPSLSERNRAKNRFPELISDKVSRIYLKRYPTSDEDSDYLSAVYVDGVKLQNQYLTTQLPMPSTINDFWRMIAEFKAELIVMLQPPDPNDSSCCAIAPASGEFKPTPYLNITAKEIVESENYTSQKLLLVDNSEKPSREQSVTILCCTEWKPGRNQPPPPVMTMVTFWQATERIARGDGPTVTLCHDGVTGCGLYLALSFMLERMAVERECDVCLAVRAVRRSRPDFVRSLEHLEYLYDAAMTYLEYFETYANFS